MNGGLVRRKLTLLLMPFVGVEARRNKEERDREAYRENVCYATLDATQRAVTLVCPMVFFGQSQGSLFLPSSRKGSFTVFPPV